MRFSVQLPTERVESGADCLHARAIGEMARAAEEAGFDACFVSEHPIPGDRWLRAGGHHTLDPFVALACAAAATRTIRLQTNVLVLPYRNPFLAAKAAASLDVASGGRLILGVAPGYQEAEFEALGVDPGERNELTDEGIDAMRRAWAEEGIALEGRHFRATGNTALPRPVQQPGPPIWVGGNSRGAIRRAVERGDGWLPFPAPARMAAHVRTAAIESAADLAERLAYAREHAERIGRTTPLDVCFVPFGFQRGADAGDADRLRAESAELERLGVTWLALNVPCASRAEFCERVAALGRAIRPSERD